MGSCEPIRAAGEPLHPGVEVGVAASPARGESTSGDAHVAVSCRGGLLVGVIDGLGHGAPAGAAAARAAEVLREHCDDPLTRLLERCHVALAHTRGAAVTVARLDARARTLTWLGVGNVAGRIVHTDEARGGAGSERGGGAAARSVAGGGAQAALLLAGVVGAQLPALRTVTLPLREGDTLLLATDGVDPDIGGELRVPGALGPLADGLLQRHRRSDGDDALVLLVRFHGTG